MANKIQIRRGMKKNMPQLSPGEFGFTVDTEELFVGNGDGNKNIPVNTKTNWVSLVVGTTASGHTADDCDYLCDGTDDQVQINAAIQALPAIGGKVLLLEGTYNIAASILVNKNNVTLEGMGHATVLKRMWSSTAKEGVIYLNNADNAEICSLSIQRDTSISLALYDYGIYGSGGSNIVISDTYIKGHMCGVYAYGQNIRIMNNTCEGNSDSSLNQSYGICLSSGMYSVIQGNICKNFYSGIRLDSGCNLSSVVGNTCYGNVNGIDVCAGRTSVVGNCCYVNNLSPSYGRGISVNGSFNTVVGNICMNHTQSGIYLNSLTGCSVSDNICTDNTIGIALYSYVRNSVIEGNICYRGTGQSTDYDETQHTIKILYSGSTGNLIMGNMLKGKNCVSIGNNTFVNNITE